MDKELKEIRKPSHEQNKNNNKDYFFKHSGAEITINEWKNSLEGLNSRFKWGEKRISKLTEMI